MDSFLGVDRSTFDSGEDIQRKGHAYKIERIPSE
jgi:hypothetical protein